MLLRHAAHYDLVVVEREGRKTEGCRRRFWLGTTTIHDLFSYEAEQESQ